MGKSLIWVFWGRNRNSEVIALCNQHGSWVESTWNAALEFGRFILNWTLVMFNLIGWHYCKNYNQILNKTNKINNTNNKSWHRNFIKLTVWPPFGYLIQILFLSAIYFAIFPLWYSVICYYFIIPLMFTLNSL